MTKDEMLKVLKDTFKDYEFFEKEHYYEYKGKRVGISVTRFIEEYANKFDSYGVAEKVAKRDNKTIKQVLDEWQLTNDLACEKGHLGHCYAQSKWNDEIYKEHIKDGLQDVIKPLELIKKQADEFYNDFNDRLEHLIDELPIGSPESDIASCVDDLFINKYTGGLVLVDYKTNSDIYKDQKYYKNARKKPQKMKIPLNHLDDYKIIHYYIQLSIYRYIIEKYSGLKVDEMFIVYFSENNDNYKIIDVPYLEDEVKKILELRRINKMGKMLLVMGEQGSGKSFSLKNLPPKEHFYIDCDKKGMNYKGWRNDYNEEQKNYIKCNDGETIVNLLKNISEKAEHIKYVSIDTINSIMIADELKRSKQKGFDKWDDMANIILQIIMAVPDLRDDLTVIFIGHTQTSDDGFTQLKTNGRKLNKIGVEGYFNTVLLAKCVNAENNEYVFETKANNSTARTPYEAFDTMTIPNDIVKVIEVIREY
jgi:hypothetical protein